MDIDKNGKNSYTRTLTAKVVYFRLQYALTVSLSDFSYSCHAKNNIC